MKTRRHWLIVPTALVINFAVTSASLAESLVLPDNPMFQQNQLVVSGTSGGPKSTDCGNIAAKPNQVIQVKQSLPYLRLNVKSDGQPTLLVDGPAGRFCVRADSYSGGNLDFSGYWPKGSYSVSVGQLADGQYDYTIFISQKNN